MKRIVPYVINFGFKTVKIFNIFSLIKSVIKTGFIWTILALIAFFIGSISHENDIYRVCKEQGHATFLQSSKKIECKVVE
jgi:hypothetical protein